MKNVKGLLDFVKSKIGVKYLYGYKGEPITINKNKYLKNAYPNVWTERYLQIANSWIGDIAVDCSGLISWYTGLIRGSSQYKQTATETVKYYKGMDLTPYIGWGIWLQGHIGIVVDSEHIIEARGQSYGVVKTKASERNFTHLIKLKDINYSDQIETTLNGWLKVGNNWKYFNNNKEFQSGVFLLPTSKGKQYFAFDNEGNMIVDINKLYITDFGNIEVRR